MINIKIKADIHNITLSDMFYILQNKERHTESIYLAKLKGFLFKVETEIDELSINYTITELI